MLQLCFFFAVDWVGRLLSAEVVGTVEAGSSIGSVWDFLAVFLALQATLASAACFFLAHSPMAVDRNDA